jgi:hypothetical protein
MADLPILPGSTVVVRDGRSIYNGYRGFVQRISGPEQLQQAGGGGLLGGAAGWAPPFRRGELAG